MTVKKTKRKFRSPSIFFSGHSDTNVEFLSYE